ncbi:tamo [Carabus blaptoides fortunei]
MAEYFVQDRLQELWQQIHHLHLTYLDTEDSPQKIEQRNRLEACIREYLCITPHNRKFFCPETAEVLHRSASSKKDFSGYRAALAWNAVSMYAGNLLSQPWRKEYRTIKTYSGFYKHQIEANLVGAEAMFEAMGYKHAGDGILVLEGPVCPDRVANVSQDSIVAFVECQILKTIWEEHIVTHPPSIPAIHSFPPPTGHHAHHYGVQPITGVQCPAQCIYSSNPYYNYSTYAPVPQSTYPPRYGAVPSYHSVPPMQCATKQQQPCNGYCYPNGCVPPQQPTYMCPVPTGQLIELDNPHNGLYDVTDSSAAKRQNDQLDAHKQLAKSTNLDSLTLSKSKEDGAGTFESWDYVYRNLESQGYNKDLGERPDVLQQSAETRRKHSLRDAKKSKPSIELEDEFNNLNLNTTTSQMQPMKINEAMKMLKDHETTTAAVTRKLKVADNARVAQSSSYDNITSQDSVMTRPLQLQHPTAPMKSVSNGIAKNSSKTLPRERLNMVSPEKPNHLATLDSRKFRKQDVDKLKVKEPKLRPKDDSTGWNCNTCTYLNSPSVEICIICGKSKKSVDVVMAVGGSQCPRCTLVNPKELSECQACAMSLLNSPTYI